MKDPCKSGCIERDFCQGKYPCKKKQAFIRWKEKAASLWKDKKRNMADKELKYSKQENEAHRSL